MFDCVGVDIGEGVFVVDELRSEHGLDLLRARLQGQLLFEAGQQLH